MTMDDDLHNRDNNYTVPANQPLGMRIPEFVFAQLIGFVFQEIRRTIDTNSLIDELFAFTTTATIKRVKDYLREHKNFFIGANWPSEDVHLPLITVINQGEQEATDQAFLGDATGVEQFGTFGDQRLTQRQAKAVPLRVTTNIYVASSDDELTLVLYNIVRFIFLSNKMQLSQLYDVHNLTISGQALEYDPELHPVRGFYRVLQLQFLTMFDWNLSEEAAKIVSLNLIVEALAGGVKIQTPVPSP